MAKKKDDGKLSAKQKDNMPDSEFGYIDPATGKKHFPLKNKSHVANALARMGQSPIGHLAKPKILAAAKKFGVEVDRDAVAENAKKSKALHKKKKKDD